MHLSIRQDNELLKAALALSKPISFEKIKQRIRLKKLHLAFKRKQHAIKNALKAQKQINNLCFINE